MDLSLSPLAETKYKSDRQLHAVSVLKFILALMVIQIHAPSAWRDVLMPLFRVAVPCFFMISGYFLLTPDGTFSTLRLKRVIGKMAVITLTANMFYIAVSAIMMYRNGHDVVAEFSSVRLWIRALLLGDSFGLHLWYLTAYLETLLVIYIAVRTRSERMLYWVACIGILLNLVAGGYSYLFFMGELPIDWSRNFLTVGIPSFMVGVWLRRNEHRIAASRGVMLSVLMAAIAVTYIEWWIIGVDLYSRGNVFFATLPLALIAFCFSLQLSGEVSRGGVVATIGARYSLDIYTYHLFAIFVMQWAIDKEYADYYGLIAIPVTAMVLIGVNLFRVAGRHILGYLPRVAWMRTD